MRKYRKRRKSYDSAGRSPYRRKTGTKIINWILIVAALFACISLIGSLSGRSSDTPDSVPTNPAQSSKTLSGIWQFKSEPELPLSFEEGVRTEIPLQFELLPYSVEITSAEIEELNAMLASEGINIPLDAADTYEFSFTASALSIGYNTKEQLGAYVLIDYENVDYEVYPYNEYVDLQVPIFFRFNEAYHTLNNWEFDFYRTIIIREPQKVSEAFHAWFTANATYLGSAA